MVRYFEPVDPEKHAANDITNNTEGDVMAAPNNARVDHSQSATVVS